MLPSKLPSAWTLVELLKRPGEQDPRVQAQPLQPGGCAQDDHRLANTARGTLLLGVEDGSRHVQGCAMRSMRRSVWPI